ncbi:Putative late blight resistance protein homolog R1A-4 [Olea europaea subsp. europaea]|uniref:Late blight resistance protein homolog R1A-4 n=1 Tax=Olea europaea subsp. europaea TaxID=158383 RepID=A0A8S0R738_OLEEU|nr:Putative late blight resistance protein homolog R1A-4 [Olea europaea subsp. europaea]
MLTTGSQIHDCYEHYELKTYAKLFWCDGCKMKGFGERYACNLCGHELHEECRHPTPEVSHENFGGSIFKFHYKPFTRLGKKNRREFSKVCDACGEDIRGFNYHYEEDNLDLHPCCRKLENKLVFGGMIFDLEVKLSSKCGMCGRKKIPRVENNVRGWSYVSQCKKYHFHVSQCKKYHFHVYCMTEMVHEACMNRFDLALENMDFREFSNLVQNSLKGDERFETFVVQRILVPTVPVYMEELCFRYDLETDLSYELKLSAIRCKISRSPQAYRAFFELLMSLLQDLRVVFTIPKQRMSKFTPTPHPNELVMVFIDFLVQLLEEIMRLEPDFIVPVKGSIKNLQAELGFLISFLGDAPLRTEVDVTKKILSDIEVVVNEVGSFLYSLFSTRDDSVLETVRLSLSLSDFLQEFEILKTKIKEHCTTVPKLPGCVATKSSVISFFTVDSLLDDLEDLINYKSDRIVPVKDQIIMLYEDISLLRSALNYIDGARLSQLLEKIHLVKMEIQEKKSSSIDAGIPEEEYPCEQVQPQAKELDNLEDDFVGFEDEQTKIADQLTSGSKKRQIISIVGMPGLGKTTLAKKLFYDPSIVEYFDKRAWCVVSQTYKKENVLVDILTSISGRNRETIMKMEEKNLGGMLHKNLNERRYLIVLDDVWDKKVWYDFKRYFPDDTTGSRILITSRNKELGFKFVVNDLRFLSDAECWELLRRKVFQTEPCPTELLEIGKHIAAKCRGLPLSIITISSILANMQKKESSWGKIAGHLNEHIFDSTNNCLNILKLSYQHLPVHLKPCFLYFGALKKTK